MPENKPLSNLLIRLGHIIFEEWEQFCGNEACKKLKNIIGNSYEIKIFYKVPIEMQIHWITEFICDYVCNNRPIEVKDETILAANFLIKIVLRKLVEREISFGKSPHTFDTKVTSSPLMDQSSGGDEQFFYSKLSENVGNSESQMDHQLQEQLHSLLADAFENDRSSSNEEDESDSTNHDDDNHWRRLTSQVYFDLFSQQVDFSNSDTKLWNSILDQIINETFPTTSTSNKKIDFTQDQIKKMKKPNNDFVNADMCRLQFTCQLGANLFQYSFREKSESVLKEFESFSQHNSSSSTVPSEKQSNLPNAFSILTACHWHLKMANSKSAYSSPSRRLEAFEKVLAESGNFPLTCAAHSIPFENSQFAQAFASSVKSIKSYFGFH